MSGLLLASAFEGHEIRVVGTPEAPEWVAADAASALGIRNIRTTIARFSGDEKGVHTVDTPGGNQELSTITEAGLFRLIFRSRRPEAERFRRWVFHDVLPAIRKHGAYSLEGMVCVRQEAWDENRLAIELLGDAYQLTAQANTKLSSLAGAMLAARRWTKPDCDPRQKLINFDGRDDAKRLDGGSA